MVTQLCYPIISMTKTLLTRLKVLQSRWGTNRSVPIGSNCFKLFWILSMFFMVMKVQTIQRGEPQLAPGCLPAQINYDRRTLSIVFPPHFFCKCRCQSPCCTSYPKNLRNHIHSLQRRAFKLGYVYISVEDSGFVNTLIPARKEFRILTRLHSPTNP